MKEILFFFFLFVRYVMVLTKNKPIVLKNTFYLFHFTVLLGNGYFHFTFRQILYFFSSSFRSRFLLSHAFHFSGSCNIHFDDVVMKWNSVEENIFAMCSNLEAFGLEDLWTSSIENSLWRNHCAGVSEHIYHRIGH